jgi:histidinol-phosphate aminotransferase
LPFRKPSLEGFAPYVPGFQPPDGEGWVKLNTNESPFPPSPAVLRAIGAEAGHLNLYPDPEQTAFRAAAAEALGVRPEQVLAGNGGDELLAMAVRAFVPTGSRLAVLGPTYSLMPALAHIAEVELEEHRWPPAFDAVPAAFATSDAPLKYLCNPNSPTGTFIPLDQVVNLCRRSPGVVLLDEAYVDFAPDSGLASLAGCPNLLLVRTMSKSYSLAGLRLGYAIAGRELMAELRLVKDSYNVGRLPLAAAVAAFGDPSYRDECVGHLRANRARLASELRVRGWELLEPGGNFVWGYPGGRRDEGNVDVFEHLYANKVLVRRFDLGNPAGSGYRITVGTWEQCQVLLDALDAMPGNGGSN